MDTPSTPGAAAPISSPAATSSAAPSSASTPASSPATPAAASGFGTSSTPSDFANDTRSNEQIIIDRLTPAFAKDGVGGSPNMELQIDVPSDNGEVIVPNVGTEQGEDGPAGAPSAEDGGAPAADDTFQDFGLDDTFGPIALSGVLKDDPAATAALEANPALKAAVFANARKAERAVKYDQILGSPEEAKVAVEGHASFTGISGLMNQVKPGDAQSLSAVINAMVDQTVLRDEEGNPLKNADGTFQTNNSVGRFLKTFFTDRLEGAIFQATQAGDDEYLAAIDTVMERMKLRAPSSTNTDEMSDELKAQKADLEAREKALSDHATSQRNADVAASDARVQSATDASLNTSVTQILAKATGLDDFTRQTVERDIRRGLRDVIRSKNTYWSQREAIEARPLGPKRDQALIKLNQDFANNYLPQVATGVLSKAGVSVIRKQQQRLDTQAAREAAASSESRGSLPPSTNSGQPDTASVAQVEADLQTKLGRRPTTEEIIAERMTRRGAAAARR